MSEPRIFLSYRRSDSPSSAGRLYDTLSREFGSHRTFMDVDDIPPGVNFVECLNDVVAQSSVVLVLIGPGWTDASDHNGDRRIDDPNDFVRLEIEAALARDIPVIPVLVEDASFPAPDELPESLKPLAFRNAVQLGHVNWARDSARLIAHLRTLLDGPDPSAGQTNVPDTGTMTKSFNRWMLMAPFVALFSALQGILGQIGNWMSRGSHSTPALDHARAEEADTPLPPDIGDIFRATRIEGADLTEVMTRLESANIEILRGSHDVRALEDHLKHFGNGITKSLALAELEFALWSTAVEQKTPKTVLAYLARFPNGTYADEARCARQDFDEAGDLDGQRLPRIFMNYRRIDSQDSADRILEKLVQWIPKRNIVIDVDRHSITPGLPIRPQLEKLVCSCDIMLVLIHNRWVTEFTKRADKHLSGESPDFVRIEIEAALERDDEMPIVPLLLGDAPNPLPAKLPVEIRAVMQRSWRRVSRESFDQDIASLIRQMSSYIERKSIATEA